jgi:hypothetical protein
LAGWFAGVDGCVGVDVVGDEAHEFLVFLVADPVFEPPRLDVLPQFFFCLACLAKSALAAVAVREFEGDSVQRDSDEIEKVPSDDDVIVAVDDFELVDLVAFAVRGHVRLDRAEAWRPRGYAFDELCVSVFWRLKLMLELGSFHKLLGEDGDVGAAVDECHDLLAENLQRHVKTVWRGRALCVLKSFFEEVTCCWSPVTAAGCEHVKGVADGVCRRASWRSRPLAFSRVRWRLVRWGVC